MRPRGQSRHGVRRRPLRLSPVERLTDSVLEDADYLAAPGVAAEARFAEHELSVERNFEPTVVSRFESDAAKYRRPARQYLLGQAHGPVEIVSRDAELD